MIRTLSSRLAALAVLATATLLLGGCAAMNRLDNEVSTYGAWPSDRKPASFAFERLPSQQARPERQQVLEDAARGALEDAGFVAAADPVRAEFGVEVGARVSFNDPWYESDPLFWHGSLRFGSGFRHGPWGRSGFGFGVGYNAYASSSFDREVALLIRDRKTGQLLYEARASNSGPSASIDRLLPPMFRAAMTGFPGTGPNPRNVTVPLAGQ